MKKIIVTFICAAILIPVAGARNDSVNFGGIKVGSCKEKSFEVRTSTSIDEYEVGANAILVSANGNQGIVSLCAQEKGRFSSFLVVRNSGTVLDSLNLVGTGT